jgi:hypothetical protein
LTADVIRFIGGRGDVDFIEGEVEESPAAQEEDEIPF